MIVTVRSSNLTYRTLLYKCPIHQRCSDTPGSLLIKSLNSENQTRTRSCFCYNFRLLLWIVAAKLLCIFPHPFLCSLFRDHPSLPCLHFYAYYYVWVVALHHSARGRASLMVLSEEFYFRNFTQQLHTASSYNRCACIVHTVSRIHNISTGFFCIGVSIFIPSVLWMECAASMFWK
jgi:hypothetical protein